MSETFDPPLADVSSNPEFNTPYEVLQELVRLFNEARYLGEATIQSAVGSRFEARARAALATLEEPA